MKKTLVSSALIVGLFASVAAFADTTTICPKTSGSYITGPGAVPNSGTPGTHFMITPISPKCSANTNMVGTDGTSGGWYAAGANANKGRTNYGAFTNGGAPVKTSDCSVAGACTATEAGSAKDAANSLATNS